MATPLCSPSKLRANARCRFAFRASYASRDRIHFGGEVTSSRELSDKRGDELVNGILELVDRLKPLQVTLVGGEPMVRHRELGQIIPELSRRGIFSMVVTSGIIPIPVEWIGIPRFVAAVSIDGLPEHHDVRRHPATYERILNHLAGRLVNIHWTITAQMLERPDYLEEYVRFWNARPEVRNIWVSLYSPQRGEQSVECLSAEQRRQVARRGCPRLARGFASLSSPCTIEDRPCGSSPSSRPSSPKECGFSRLSKNFSADLKTHVEPCVFGGDPDCSQCGCSASAATHWISGIRLIGPLKARHLLHGSMRIGSAMARLQKVARPAWRERSQAAPEPAAELVQISSTR